MKTTKRSPAPQSTKAAKKQVATTKPAAPRDAAAPKTTPAKGAATPKPRDSRLPAPGTKLTRTWHEKEYAVAVGDETFAFAGKTYPSLSAVAREIIGGAQVNGYLWFGLTGARQPKAKGAAPAKAGKGAKATKPVEPKIGGASNAVATPAGQRAALAAAGLTKKAKGAKAASTEGAAK